MSERTSSLLPSKGAYLGPQEIYPQNPHSLVENFTSVEDIGRKTFGALLVTTGLFMVIWGATEAINGAARSHLSSFVIGAAVAYAGWKIAGKGFELIKKIDLPNTANFDYHL